MKSGRLRNSLFFLVLSAIYIIFYFAGGNHLCYFKAAFGVPCPGCGLTRAFICLFSGDLPGAFYFHPLFLPVIGVTVLAVFQKTRIIRNLGENNMFWFMILFLFIITYVIRMILFFPDSEPMTLNHSSVLFRIIGILKNVM